MMHTKDGMADKFIADISANVAEMMKMPEKPVDGKVLFISVDIHLPTFGLTAT